MSATVETKSPGLLGMLPLLRERREVFVLTILSGVLSQAGTLACLALGAWIVGHAMTGTPASSLVTAYVLLGVAVIVAAVARWWQAYISHDLAFALIETLQVGIYDGLERAAPGYVLGRRTGELASIATTDAELMEFFYAHTVADYVGAVVVPLAALAAMFAIEPVVAFALLPFLPLVASVPFWLARRAGEQGVRVAAETGTLNAETVELMQGLRELTVFGRTRDFLERLAARTGALAAAQRRYGSRAGLEHAAIDIITAAAVLVATLAGLALVVYGGLDRALFPLLVVLAGAALAPIVEVTQTARKLGELRAGAARILAIFHQPAAIADTGRAPPSGESHVRFEDVSFAYDETRGPVLDGVNLTIARGETVALVGRSGAGKSTCANLLLRLRDVDAGRIRIGGRDVRDLPIAVLRKLVAYVPQDVHLFDETVADNIRLGAPDAPPAAVERAAKLAQAHAFIEALPQGYDTRCGEGGARLSGGQRQRIAIARALLVDAPVLVLDEAASSLDTENEALVQRALDAARRDRTVLVIAHRLSTIRAADRVVMLEDGRVAEEGTHEALLAQGGAYARLVVTPDALE